MKRLIGMSILAIALGIVLAITVNAGVYVESRQITFIHNGSTFTSGHQIYHNRMLVPLRTMATNLGYSIEYNNSDESIHIFNDKDVVSLQVGNNKIFKNNNLYITMDTVPVIIDNRAFVPIRFIAEALGKFVRFYEDNTVRVISITDANPTQDLY